MKKWNLFQQSSWLALAVMATGMTNAVAGNGGPSGLPPSQSPKPSPSPSATSPSVASPAASSSSSDNSTAHINVDTIRTLMIQANPSLRQEINAVVQAKDVVRGQRNALFPGVSLGSALAISPLSFSFSSISFLMPFLAPSNWFNYNASKDNLDADELSFKILELNTYATLYAMYDTAIEDQNLESMLSQEYQDWEQIVSLMLKEAAGGAESQQDIESAENQRDTAKGAMLTMQQTLVTEKAQMKYALHLSADQEVVFDPIDVTPSQYESWEIAPAVKHSVDIAPERLQLVDLIKAGKDASWSDTLSIMNGGVSVGAGNPYSGSGSIFPDLSTSTIKDTFPLSLTTPPLVSLDDDKVDALNITLDILSDGQQQTLDETINGLKIAIQALDTSAQSEQEASDVYRLEMRKFNWGATDLENVLTDFTQAHAASMARIEAQANVDTLRITLKRAMLEDEFSKLPGCVAAPSDPVVKESLAGEIWHGFIDIFSGKHSTETLDTLCHSGENQPTAAPSGTPVAAAQ